MLVVKVKTLLHESVNSWVMVHVIANHDTYS